jgi:hypothetical protein
MAPSVVGMGASVRVPPKKHIQGATQKKGATHGTHAIHQW